MMSEKVTSIGNSAFEDCSSLSSITLPNGVTSIGNFAFCGCRKLTSIIIPKCVANIGKVAFGMCDKLELLSVNHNNPVYDSRDNCNAIIETETNTLVAGCKNTIIPNSITSIGKEAFSCCRGLKSIVIPYSVKTIGIGAFFNCDELTTLTITNPVTKIEENVLMGSFNIKKII